MLLVKTLVKTCNKKIKIYCNSGNKKQEQAKARAITGNATLQLIQNADNDEIDEKYSRNKSNHSVRNSN